MRQSHLVHHLLLLLLLRRRPLLLLLFPATVSPQLIVQHARMQMVVKEVFSL